MDDDYYERLERAKIMNDFGLTHLIAKNIAEGFFGLVGGVILGGIAKVASKNPNPAYAAIVTTLLYDSLRMLVPMHNIKNREALMTKKSKPRLILEDSPGFFAGNILGYYLTSLIPTG